VDAKCWLEQLRAELARRKLPPQYVERFVGELSDHLTDFLEDRMSTDAKDLHGVFVRLGAPGTVADSAVKEYRKSRFSRRHPVLVFVVMPVVTLFLLWIGALLTFGLSAGAVSWLIGGRGERFPQWLVTVMPVIASAIVLAPIALAAAWFCRVAGRAGSGWKWPLAACLVLALIGGAAFFDMKLPGTQGLLHGTKFQDTAAGGEPKGHMMFGFGINRRPRPWQVLQFSIPLAVCALFAWRQVRRQRQHVLSG
jgi:hypothetical protein